MTPDTCSDVRVSLGAYVLGALEPTERHEVDRHVDQCPACRDDLAEIAGLPGLLAHVHVDDIVGDDPEAPPELLDRLLAAASTERRRTRRWRLAAATAAVVVGCIGGAVVVQALDDGGTDQPAPATGQVFRASDAASGVDAKVTATPTGWGTALRIQLSGVPRGERCSLVVVAAGGERESVAKWKVDYEGGVDVDGSTDLTLPEVVAFDVVTKDGRRLVRIPA